MGNYSVPEKIRNLKPKGTIIKLIHNKYYVYEHFYRKDSDGKWKTKSGKLLGYIDETKGFIPNTNCLKQEETTTYEYGQYAIVINNSIKVLEKLCDFFNIKDAYTIYLLSVVYLVNDFVPLKDIELYINQSYLSILHSDISFSYYNLSLLLDNLGRKQKKVFEFEQSLINESTGEIAIDGHDIKSSSHENNLADKGNKFNTMKDMQLNVLMAFDINTEKPLTSRMYPGSLLDKSSVQDLLSTSNFKNALFIIDRGFYSKENIKLFSDNGNSYIIPLLPNLLDYKKATEDMKLSNVFVYEKNKKRTTVEYKKMQLDKNTKIFIYRDLSQSAKDSADYLKNIELNPEKYTIEKYNEVKDFFGVLVIQTNLDKSSKEIYELYKKRWAIETFFNYFKNTIDINSLGINNYYATQGLSFIMLIVGLIHHELKENFSSIRGKSIDDCLLEARFAKLNFKNGIYSVSKIKKDTQNLLETLHTNIQNPLNK